MRNLHKLLLPLLLFSTVLLMTACQTQYADDSSVIEKTAAQIEADVCADLEPEALTADQYDSLPAWYQEIWERAAERYLVRCP